MKPPIQQMLDAHVQHELKRYDSQTYRREIQNQVELWFDWLQQKHLQALVTEEIVLDMIQRFVVEMPVAGGLIELLGETGRLIINAPANQETALKDIFPRKLWKTVVDFSKKLNPLRRGLLLQEIESSGYFPLVSGILFHGIKTFLLSENPLLKRIPGVSAFLRNQTQKPLPRWESTVEAQIRDLIEKSLRSLLKQSEPFVQEFMERQGMAEQGEEIWDVLFTKKLALPFSSIEGEDIEDLVVFGHEFWMHFRKTRYFREIYTLLVHGLFEKYKDHPLDVLLDDLEITPELVTDCLYQYTYPVVQHALAGGMIEKGIRTQLESFYQSAALSHILSKSSQ